MAVSYFRKLFIILLFFIVLYFKFIYSFVFALFFWWEHVFFIRFVFDILKNRKNYICIKINEIEFYRKSSVDLWFEYSRMLAFKRLYLMLSRKGISFLNVIFVFSIIILGIPFRFIKLLFVFLKSSGSFRDTLEGMCWESYWNLKNCKIEVLDGKIYLNGYNLIKFYSNFSKCNVDKQKILSACLRLQEVLIHYQRKESESRKIALKMIAAFDKNGKILWKNHYGFVMGSNSIHATSNVPSHIPEKYELLNTEEFAQWADIPMPSMVTAKSTNAGSIISVNVYSINEYSREKYIPEIELHQILFNNHKFFDVSDDVLDYFWEKNTDIDHALLVGLGNEYSHLDKRFLKDLHDGWYNFIICNSTLADLVGTLENLNMDRGLF